MSNFSLHTSRAQAIALIVSALLAAVLAGCGPADLTPTPASQPGDAYPPPAASPASVNAYPAATEPDPDRILISLDKPVAPGATTVSGVGPPGLPIRILNATFMGEQMGSGVIGDNGAFLITIAPAQPGTRIGLTADLEAIGLTDDDVQRGDGAISIPQVGNFYDSVVIPQS